MVTPQTLFAEVVAADLAVLDRRADAAGLDLDRQADLAGLDVLDRRADAAGDRASLRSAAREIVDTKFIARTT